MTTQEFFQREQALWFEDWVDGEVAATNQETQNQQEFEFEDVPF